MKKKRILSPDRIAECLAAKELFLAKKNELGLNQRKVADAVGISPAAVAMYFNGENPLNAKFATALAELLKEPVARFSPRLAEEISYLSRSAEVRPAGTRIEVAMMEPGTGQSPSSDDYALIRQYSAQGECGGGILNDHVEVSGSLAFKRDWLKRMGAKPEHLFVIYASGSSMEPYIFDGDVVLFDSSDIEPRDRQVYAIRRPDGGVSIKRMAQQLSGNWLIRSDNSDKARYPDEEVSPQSMHDVPIMGRVIWRGGALG